MKVRKLIIIAITVLCAIAFSVGATFALLSSASSPVENSFTFGKVAIELTETTGNDYKLVPGTTVAKDPTVTVKKDSEACWLFVSVQAGNGAEAYITYQIADGWTAFDGAQGVYYRQVEETAVDTAFAVLKDNAFMVKDTLTEEKMSQITHLPTLTVYAIAVQSHSVTTAAEAWSLAQAEM